MKKISVIIPMYKAKEYIPGCVSSVLNQDIDDYEVILVDDASPDDTYDYAKKLYENDDRIKVIKQDINAGPGIARNKGIDIATGEYIAFCDVDDYLVPNTLNIEYKYAKDNNLDLFWTMGLKMLISKETKKDLSLYGDDRMIELNVYNGGTEYEDAPVDIKTRLDKYINRAYGWSAWGKLYKKTMLDKYNIRFSHLKMAEDQIFVLESIIYAEKFGYKLMFPNIYRIGNTSLTKDDDNEKYFIRALDSTIGSVKVLSEKLSKNILLDEIPEYREKLVTFQRYTIENFYTLPLYKEIGKDKILKNEEVDKVFKKYYGDNAMLEKEKLFASYDNSKDNGIPFYKELTYEKYEKLLDKNTKTVTSFF